MKPPPFSSQRECERIARELLRLGHSDNCSICDKPFRHNCRTVGGLDAHGNVVLAGECCISQVAQAVNYGNYFTRQYDSLPVDSSEFKQAAALSAAFQEAVARLDKEIENIERRGGTGLAAVTKVCFGDYLWKADDNSWFEQNPKRSHRARLAFPGEFDEVGTIPAEYELVVLVRQVEPSSRLSAPLFVPINLLPIPDGDEAAACALFQMATRREPIPTSIQALAALVEKYKATREAGQ